MKPKKIYIDRDTDLEGWTERHHQLIVNILYDNVFDFVKGDELRRTVLRVITKDIPVYDGDTIYEGLSYDFMLIRDNINYTIDALIKNFEDLEEYEKCADLLELRNQI